MACFSDTQNILDGSTGLTTDRDLTDRGLNDMGLTDTGMTDIGLTDMWLPVCSGRL